MGLLALLTGSFALGRLSVAPSTVEEAAATAVAVEDSERNEAEEYQFISPLLQCENAQPGGFLHIRKARASVHSVIEEAKKRGDISMAAVYYRDLNNGPWFGENEGEPFFPASLLKVPLLLTYLREAESNPAILQRKLVYDGTPFTITQNYVFGEPLKSGRSYSVKELLEKMILTSDNTAMAILTSEELVSDAQLERVYKAFAIDSPIREGYQINPVTYASFFRVLYNATYLSRDLSEYALELMSHSDFNEGLRSGVPLNIPISHKFGERYHGQTGERQLHDCGIVYAPGKPYLICIMTRGSDFKRLSAVIGEISKQVYTSLR
jgi:beta-lactamase class A